MSGLGTLPVYPPITGQWPFQGFPPSVQIDGTTFNQAVWAWPFYGGVVAQYREAVASDAMHLLVYRNGFFEIGHLDEVNPDLGNPIEHAIVDAPLATTIAFAIGGFAIGLVGGLLLLD